MNQQRCEIKRHGIVLMVSDWERNQLTKTFFEQPSVGNNEETQLSEITISCNMLEELMVFILFRYAESGFRDFEEVWTNRLQDLVEATVVKPASTSWRYQLVALQWVEYEEEKNPAAVDKSVTRAHTKHLISVAWTGILLNLCRATFSCNYSSESFWSIQLPILPT